MYGSGRRRPAETESRWRRIIGELDRSGQSLRRFAAGRGLNPNTVTFWRYELRRRDGAGHPAAARVVGKPDEVSPAPAFLPVTVSAAVPAAEERTVAGTIEIMLMSGHIVRVSGEVDGHRLRQVLSLLDPVC